MVEDAQAKIEPLYEAGLKEELDRIVDAVPHDQLAIQWDICIEVWMWDRWLSAPFVEVEREVVDRVARIGRWVPDDVQLGHHYCYGDFQHSHFQQPADAAVLTEMANRMVWATPRRVDWVHLPVPIERTDDAFYAPLDALRLSASTEIYLGLIHIRDGVDGARERVRSASAHLPTFGWPANVAWAVVPPGTEETTRACASCSRSTRRSARRSMRESSDVRNTLGMAGVPGGIPCRGPARYRALWPGRTRNCGLGGANTRTPQLPSAT